MGAILCTGWILASIPDLFPVTIRGRNWCSKYLVIADMDLWHLERRLLALVAQLSDAGCMCFVRPMQCRVARSGHVAAHRPQEWGQPGKYCHVISGT